jgi:hypothetical protein
LSQSFKAWRDNAQLVARQAALCKQACQQRYLRCCRSCSSFRDELIRCWRLLQSLMSVWRGTLIFACLGHRSMLSDNEVCSNMRSMSKCMSRLCEICRTLAAAMTTWQEAVWGAHDRCHLLTGAWTASQHHHCMTKVMKATQVGNKIIMTRAWFWWRRIAADAAHERGQLHTAALHGMVSVVRKAWVTWKVSFHTPDRCCLLP